MADGLKVQRPDIVAGGRSHTSFSRYAVGVEAGSSNAQHDSLMSGVAAADIHAMSRRRIKECRPQFVRMNPEREESPPPREVTCPDYRTCLSEAAFRNLCLDCSQCIDEAPAMAHRPAARHRSTRTVAVPV